jgi:ABC-type methionine transport system permease subunit
MLILTICLVFGLMSNGESSDVTSHYLGIIFGVLLTCLESTGQIKDLKLSPITKWTLNTLTKKSFMVLSVIALNLIWLYSFYGGDEEEIAASFNMGCNYSRRV